MLIGDLLYRGPLNIRKRLFRDILGIILITVCALGTLAILQGRTLKDKISEQFINESSLLIKKRFSDYINQFDTGLRLLSRIAVTNQLNTLQEEDLFQTLAPFMDTYEHIQQITVSDPDQHGAVLVRSSTGYIPKTLTIDENATLKRSELYRRALEAPDSSPVVWMSKENELSDVSGFSAAIKVDFPRQGKKLVIEFFITASKIISFITDTETPDGVDIIFYNQKGMFLSRKLIQVSDDAVINRTTIDNELAPAETRKALSLWKDNQEHSRSVKKFVLNGITWWAGYSPLNKEENDTWICIVIPETHITNDVKEQWLQLILIGAGILVGAIVLSIGLVRKYGSQLKDLPHTQLRHESLEENVIKMINAGESGNLEFKSTMRTNLQTGKSGKEIELAWLKGVVAFMNSDGGIVLIGIDDNGKIIGIDQDGFASEDKCRLHFRNLINTHIGAEYARYIHLTMCRLADKDILVIECERVREPVFLKIGKSEEFYVRSGPSSMKLTISQTVHYLAGR